MNFLAHQYLSFHVEPVMVGNFLADTLKGKERGQLPKDIYKGVETHHLIDNYTDSHPLVLETRKILYPYFSKYAAVVQDVYYDHFLARDWSRFSDADLAVFTEKVYTVLGKNTRYFNERALRTYHYMSKQNWLLHYAGTEGLDRALTGLSRRAQFQNNMDESIGPLLKHEKELTALFEEFFPELKKEIRTQYGHLFK